MIEAALFYLGLFTAVTFALLKGGRPERLGALWLFINAAFHAALMAFGQRSTTAHLVADGIYATGLLPLAFLFVSWWIGIQTFIACAGFVLQAGYLLMDRPVDLIFVQASNLLFAACLANLFIATLGSIWHRRQGEAGRQMLASA